MASPSDQAQEYAADVVATLAALGVTSHIETQEARSGDALLVLPGSKLEVEVKTLLRPEAVGAILGSHRRRRPLLIISDRIPEVARERLREAGINFYDRSGHLRIVAPPVVIDTGVPSLVNTTATSHPLDTPTGRDVAIACLADARRAHGVRETARWVDRDPGSVSRVMATLRSQGVVVGGWPAGDPRAVSEPCFSLAAECHRSLKSSRARHGSAHRSAASRTR